MSLCRSISEQVRILSCQIFKWKVYLHMVDTLSETSWEKRNLNIYKIAWLRKYNIPIISSINKYKIIRIFDIIYQETKLIFIIDKSYLRIDNLYVMFLGIRYSFCNCKSCELIIQFPKLSVNTSCGMASCKNNFNCANSETI